MWSKNKKSAGEAVLRFDCSPLSFIVHSCSDVAGVVLAQRGLWVGGASGGCRGTECCCHGYCSQRLKESGVETLLAVLGSTLPWLRPPMPTNIYGNTKHIQKHVFILHICRARTPLGTGLLAPAMVAVVSRGRGKVVVWRQTQTTARV